MVYMTTPGTRSVLVTGGSAGIGLGLARRYRRAGHRVLVTGRDPGRLAAVAAGEPGVETFAGDLADPTERERLAEHVRRVLPELDVLVNNAGIQRRVGIAADVAPWSEVQNEIDVLLSAPLHLTRLLVPMMLDRGGPALVVNVSSGGAFVPQTFAPVYSAAKAAVHSYTVTLREALDRTRCQVVELIPPAVATGLAGPGAAHGADPDEFCDAVFPLLDGSRPEVGFGPTSEPGITARIDAERRAFLGSAARAGVPGFAPASRH